MWHISDDDMASCDNISFEVRCRHTSVSNKKLPTLALGGHCSSKCGVRSSTLMFYSNKSLLSEYAISVAMRWQCCDKFTSVIPAGLYALGKPKCPADGVSGIAQTDILLIIFTCWDTCEFRPYTQIAKELGRPTDFISIVISALIFILLPKWMRWTARFIITWDSGVICFLALAWSMSSATPKDVALELRIGALGNLDLIATDCTSLAIGFMLKDNKGLYRYTDDATRNAFWVWQLFVPSCSCTRCSLCTTHTTTIGITARLPAKAKGLRFRVKISQIIGILYFLLLLAYDMPG